MRFFGTLDEGKAGQFADQLAVDGWLKAEVELLEGFDVRESREPQSTFHAFEPACLPLGHQHLV
jgi:hypothetical protein